MMPNKLYRQVSDSDSDPDSDLDSVSVSLADPDSDLDSVSLADPEFVPDLDLDSVSEFVLGPGLCLCLGSDLVPLPVLAAPMLASRTSATGAALLVTQLVPTQSMPVFGSVSESVFESVSESVFEYVSSLPNVHDSSSLGVAGFVGGGCCVVRLANFRQIIFFILKPDFPGAAVLVFFVLVVAAMTTQTR
jgi:hypothetical protein